MIRLKGEGKVKKSIFHTKITTLQKRLIIPRRDIEEELAKCEAGFTGEKRLLYYLSEVEGTVRILHDIRLPFQSGYTHFQMDTVVITQYMIIILDAKHFSGNLVLDRVTRQLKRGHIAYEDPITQVLRHKRGLEHWLDKPIPITAAVVFTHPNVHLTITPSDSFDSSLLLYVQELPAKLDEFHQEKPMLLTKHEVHQLANKLAEHHQPHDPNVMRQFDILPVHLQSGIHCENCGRWSIKRIKRSWICTKCRKVMKDPHLIALKEYVHLFGTQASNGTIRAFLGIQSESVAKRLLQKWAVEQKGEGKGRVYQFPNEWKQEE